jgi:hypothetical protein
VIVRKSGFVEAEIDGEVVALNVASGTCYGLNRVGSRVWTLISAPISVGDICSCLTKEYVIDRSACEAQVLWLLEDLREEGMISAVEAP